MSDPTTITRQFDTKAEALAWINERLEAIKKMPLRFYRGASLEDARPETPRVIAIPTEQ